MCRTKAEAMRIHRQYMAEVEPLVDELVEIEIRSFPRYLLDTLTGELQLVDWHRPPGGEAKRLDLLAEIQTLRERYGFSATDVAEMYRDLQ